ncbi:MAG: InlB B-repeat-containing protein, partial [Bacteroidales bacterium]|nr:InlB B-repeat-containing protein [Bacteroidales bacterium]
MTNSTTGNRVINGLMKHNDSTNKKVRKHFALALGFLLMLLTGLAPAATAQNHGNKPAGGYANTTAQQHPMAGSVTLAKSLTAPDGRQLSLSVSGKMPSTAKVNATPVQRTMPQGKQVFGAYDITIQNGNAEWQPQSGKTVTVSISDPNFVDGQLMDVYHEGANGNELVDIVSPTNHTITFLAQSFSVYIVTEAGDDARLKVCFHQNSTSDPVIIYVKKADLTPEHFETVLYDPGVGTLEAGVSFRGWSTNSDYTKAETGKTIAGVRSDVQAILNDEANPITDGQEVHYYAMLFKTYVVSYFDGSPATLGSHEVSFRADATQQQYSYIVDMLYTPTSSDNNFMGWVAGEGNTNIVNPHNPNLYQNGDTIIITGNVNFDVDEAPGHWLVFNENGKGATYNAPQFVKSGEVTSDAELLPMERNGYTFGGWYYNAECTGDEFHFGGQLTDRTEIFAKWIAATTASYTIIIWKQKLTNQSNPNDPNADYDFEKSILIENAPTGPVPANMIQGTVGNASASVNGTSYNWTGFHYAGTNRAEVTITPEGTAVVNVYFDRDVITMNFYTWHDAYTEYQYTPTTSTSNGNYYIYENGSYTQVYLYYNNGTWYRNRECTLWIIVCLNYEYSDPVSGTVYERNTIDHSGSWESYTTMTGRYGSTLAQNGYTWPTEYDWHESYSGNTGTGTRTTFLDAFLPTSDETTIKFYASATTSGKTVHFMQHNTTGDGYTEAIHVDISSNSGGFNLSDKYTGFKCVAWNTANNTSTWTTVGELMQEGSNYYYDANPNQSGYQTASFGNSNHLYIYFDRLTYNLVYANGSKYKGTSNSPQDFEEKLTPSNIRVVENINFGENLNTSSYKDYQPDESEWPNGYVFEGWYADDQCTTPYSFTTMPSNNLKIYAKWRQVRFRVFLHPNAYLENGNKDQTLTWGSTSQQMNFAVAWGSKVSVPTGRRDGYEFVGWYRDEDFTLSFNADAFLLNNTTVPATPVYDKTVDMTDEMDRWGEIVDQSTASNSDVNRPYVRRKLDLYALWRKTVEGAIGIDVIYDANGGTNAPADENKYLDAAHATAGAASKAPAGKVFSHWVVQTFDCESGQFVDGNVTVYPGAEFIVYRNDAQITVNKWQNLRYNPDYDPNNLQPGEEPNPCAFVAQYYTVQNPEACNETTPPSDCYDKIYDATYIIQLRAEYKDVEAPTLTHITWYKNYNDGNSSPTYREDTDIHINEAVDIYGLGANESIPSRPGYIFKGWYKFKVKATTANPNPPAPTMLPDTAPNRCNPNFIYYTDGAYFADDAYTQPATQVAADEASPYDYLYAIWEPIVDFNFNPVCQGKTIALPTTTKYGVDLSSGTWSWTASAGTVDGATYTVPNQGGTVTLTFTPDAATTCAAMKSFVFTVNAAPTVSLTTPVEVCYNGTVTLTPTGLSNDITQYIWVDDPESTINPDDIQTGAPTAYTQQNVTQDFSKTILVANENGCVASDTADVTVIALPSVTLNNATQCAGGTATLEATDFTNVTHYSWDNSTWYDYDAANWEDISFSDLDPAQTYQATLYVKNVYQPAVEATSETEAIPEGACTYNTSASVTVNEVPAAELTPATVSICQGETTTLSVG